jgi:phosphatidylglycerophosphate synthase
MTGGIVAQHVVVEEVIRREARRSGVRREVDLLDLVTLCRAAAGGFLLGLIVSGIRDRRGLAGWLAWLAICVGGIATDWLDGPLVRRFGRVPARDDRPTPVREEEPRFDLEADSWLTLCTGLAAVAWGDVPARAAVPPLTRYLLLAACLRHEPYASFRADQVTRTRPLGMAQMALFIAALAPFGGPLTGRLVQMLGRVEPPLQLALQVAMYRRSRRRVREG